MRFARVLLAFAMLLPASVAAAGPVANFMDARVGVEDVTGLAAREPLPGSEHCPTDLACEARFGAIILQTHGGMVRLMPSSSETHVTYLGACAGALAGLAALHEEDAARQVLAAFGEAERAGRAEYEIDGVEFTVRPEPGGRLACEFWRR